MDGLTVLLLGGTGEARRLAALLARERPDLRVVTSLAGRVAQPALPEGEVRVGGFGGPAGLVEWLRRERVGAVLDVTHPFAARMSATAVTACAEVGVPLLVVRRPGWTAQPGDAWRRVPSLEAAAETVAELGERVFLTTGRQSLAAFAGLDRQWFLVRSVDPPEPPLPRRLTVVLDRGPFTLDAELDLLHRYAVDVLVTKDSGGSMTAAKLHAARRLGLPVVMVDRPPTPPAEEVERVEDVLPWLLRRSG
ncbi:cobalt-precorrin-6A reductase [Micromonospora sp. NBC_01699]|uniref:cobalt-precorrin-6A reductase n=1 Tax=Micromonospora sp. NBC_01699 TaxID=2975984 RepID=UPI002E2F106A|nr:cobalt-precorrin-6A reductase [Micromonospora sp. NBC_01699]